MTPTQYKKFVKEFHSLMIKNGFTFYEYGESNSYKMETEVGELHFSIEKKISTTKQYKLIYLFSSIRNCKNKELAQRMGYGIQSMKNPYWQSREDFESSTFELFIKGVLSHLNIEFNVG